ncbi:ATP-dependent RNA helicase HrpA [Hydrogenovibrio sp. JE_KL2]|uniref:ATP-dependent RNA helicase HrpA n=1 Tax=Hydrogenovibrio sp. JE_KL2 TaxID=2651188 RepID=UPI0020A4A76F|nr:ATP-dependent RNA helicase HrpA [Hydrogenovibrio sp. JE_KL2]
MSDSSALLKMSNHDFIDSLTEVLSRDRFALQKQWERLKLNTLDDAQKETLQATPTWQKFVSKWQRSRELVAANRQAVPKIEFDENLPVAKRREALRKLIEQHQVVVIAGETGSGKTTQIPKICLEAGRGILGRIGCTQPRRLAARSVAERIAEELGSSIGQLVGYQVRFHDQVHQQSLIKVMTDGILLAEVQNDPFLNQYDTIIIDEAHERSINIDFLLGILKKLLPKRPDLKVVITSATIDTQRFADYFKGAPVVEVSGRTYPVEIRYRPLIKLEDDDGNEYEQDIPLAISHALDELALEDPFGDVLVFQVGERDIKETAEVLRKQNLKNTEIIPLYARLSMAEQNKVFQTSQKRRVILSTNVAETSLTVPGIKFVIDPGQVRISRYSVRSKVQRLPIEKISQASANQRAGRCGRVSSGVCIRLYDEEDFQARPAFTPPEIHRTSLASVILQMETLRLGAVKHFPFIEPPEDKAVNDGFRQLQEIGALDEQRQLTESGKQLATLPLDPRMAKMVLEGQKNNVLAEVLIIASALSIQDPRDMNESNRQAANQAHKRFEDERSDFLFYLNLWRFYEEQRRHLSQNKLRKLCKTNYLSYLRMKEWHDLFYQLEVSLKRIGTKVGDLHLYEEVSQHGKVVGERLSDLHSIAVHRALMTGLLGNIAMRDDENTYLGARNTKLFIHPSSVLFKRKPKWMLSGELVETTKLYARNNATIDIRWVESLAKHLIKHSYADPHWQKKAGQVGAYESITLYGLPIVNRRPCNYGPINPKEAHKIFLRHGLVEGDMHCRVDFFVHNQKLIAEIQQIESKLRRLDFLVDDNVLYDFYADKIPEHIYSQPAFEKWAKTTKQKQPELIESLFLTREFLLKQSIDSSLNVEFPDQIGLQNNIQLDVDYRFEPGKTQDGMVVHIPLSNLNLVQSEDFEWLTPGLIKEKIACYIKALPKGLRKQFIPAPNYAELALKEMSPDKRHKGSVAAEPFLTQLVWVLNRRATDKVSVNDFQAVELPDYLKPYYLLEDEKGKLLAEGSDLEKIKAEYLHLVDKLIEKHQGKVGKTAHTENQKVETWDFGDLAETQTLATGKSGAEMVVYPALQMTMDGFEIALIGDESTAQQTHGDAVLALVKQLLADKQKYLFKQLPLQKACLCYAPYGTCQDLTQQIIDRALEQLVPEPQAIRKQAEFEQTLERVRSQWVEKGQKVAKQVSEILTAHQKIAKQVKGKVNPRWLASIADIQHQLDGLISKDFVRTTPETWLAQLPRYLQGLEKRLEKLDLDPAKDQVAIRQIQPLLDAYEELAQEPAYANAPNLVDFRWMLEELRLSLFAQPMKTLKPVSIQRLEKQLKEF